VPLSRIEAWRLDMKALLYAATFAILVFNASVQR
jgi:hypothetical protein